MKAKRTFRNTLAILMVFTMLLGCGGLSALAGEDIQANDGVEHPPVVLGDVTDTSNGNALHVWAANDGTVLDVTVNGEVYSDQVGDFSSAVSVSSDDSGEASVTVNGDVTGKGKSTDGYGAEVSSWGSSTTELAVDGDLNVNNTSAGGEEGMDYNTVGVYAQAVDDGSSTASFTGDVNVNSEFGAYGVEANAQAFTSAENTSAEITVGSIDVDAGSGVALGATARAGENSESTVTVTGSGDEGNAVSASSVSGNASGVKATASGGSGTTVTVESGSIEATSSSGYKTTGIDISTADSSSTATVEVLSGGIVVESSTGHYGYGIDANGTEGSSTVTVSDAVDVSGASVVYGISESGDGHASITTGDVTVESADNAYGIAVHPSGNGKADVTANGSVTVEGTGYSEGVVVNGLMPSGEKAGEANITVTGDVSVTSEQSPAVGVDVRRENDAAEATVNIGGSVTAEGEVTGATFGINVSLVDAEANINVKDDVKSNGTGIKVRMSGEEAETEIKVGGNVDASEGEYGVFINQTAEDGEINLEVGGDVKSGSVGLLVRDPLANAKDDEAIDILVNGKLEGEDASVVVNSVTPGRLTLTVYQVKLNAQGKAVVGMDDAFKEYEDENTKQIEENILYIIKVQQPEEGATLTALKEDGDDLDESHDYQVAKEGETILMKVDLAEGYKVTGAYSVDRNESLNIYVKDGQYYVEVPKGGGVYISARVEKASDDSDGNDDNGGSWYGSPAIAGRVQYVDVTFDFNGGHKLSGSTAPIVKTVPVGTWVVLVQAPLKDGAQFLGWKADKAGITVSKPGDNFCAWEPVTFTAMWSDTSAAAANTAAVTLQPAAGESAAQTVSAVQAAPTVALSEDASLTLADLLGSASPTGEGSALQAKLVVDLPNGGSMEIPVNIQLSFGTPTIIDNP